MTLAGSTRACRGLLLGMALAFCLAAHSAHAAEGLRHIFLLSGLNPLRSEANHIADVGGHMDNMGTQGAAVAKVALQVLAGKDPATMPDETRLPNSYRVDATHLATWGFAEKDLPRGTSIEFDEPSFWHRYRTEASVALVAFVMQSGAIGLLLVQVRRRRAAEISLQESEDRIALAAASTNVGFWRMDSTTDRFWATDHCRSMFGISVDTELTWKNLRTIVHPEDHRMFDALSTHRRRDSEIDNEFRISLPGGDVKWLACRGRSTWNDYGKHTATIGIFVDITARKSAELEAELQRKEIAHLMRVAALGELSGAIAHELSQPLAAILANAQAAQVMLSDAPRGTEEILQVLNDIVEEDYRAGQVVHRLRRLLTKGEHQSVSIKLNDLIRSTLALLHAELVNRKVQVFSDLHPELPSITGDPVQLQQVLLNLVMNGVDAMASTNPSNRVLCIRTRSSYEHAEVVVSDRGPGIAPAVLPKLFEPFFTTKDRGLGLGLSICSTIIGAHGGRISLVNSGGGGAVATVWLPTRSQLAA